MAVAVVFGMVSVAVKLHISRRRRVINLSSGRRNLTSTCTKFDVVSVARNTVGRGRGASLNMTSCSTTSPVRETTTMPMTKPMSTSAKVRGMIVVTGLSGCRHLGTTLGGLNMAKVAIARIVKYNVRGNTNRGCHKIRVSMAILPGMGMRIVMKGVPIRGIVRATSGALCAKRINSNGVFMCGIRGMMGMHAKRRSLRTLGSMRWCLVGGGWSPG